MLCTLAGAVSEGSWICGHRVLDWKDHQKFEIRNAGGNIPDQHSYSERPC